MNALMSREDQIAAIQAIDMDELEREMLAMPQAETPVFHSFGPGVYFREAHFPAGAYILGHRHVKSTMNIVLKGDLIVVANGGISLVQAPFMFESEPGRKFAYAITDTVWINVIPTEMTDVDEIERAFIHKLQPALEGPQ
jgi:hypothetical protein